MKGGETWNAFDVIGHLIHGERTDWMPRAQMVLQFRNRDLSYRVQNLGTEASIEVRVIQAIRPANSNCTYGQGTS